MTVKEYFEQGLHLEDRIKLELKQIENLKVLAYSLSSPGFQESFQATRNIEAPYTKTIEKILDMEKKHAEQVEMLLQFRDELSEVIETVEDKNERMVLTYHYLCNETWVSIGNKLEKNEKTIRRWHHSALQHVVMPDTPTVLEKD